MDDLDHIVDVVAARIRAQLGTIQFTEHSCLNGGCKSCGHCVEKREPEVQQIVGQGATRISAAPGTDRVADHLAAIIDHTLLKPEATPDDLKKLCNEATKYNFASVCVNSGNVARCRALLAAAL